MARGTCPGARGVYSGGLSKIFLTGPSGYNPKSELCRVLLKSTRSNKKNNKTGMCVRHARTRWSFHFFNWPSSILKEPYITRIWGNVVE
jgi:hypothetical protein